MLMDGVVEKLIGGLGNEMKDIKLSVQETERALKGDPSREERRSSGTDLVNQESLRSATPKEPEKVGHVVPLSQPGANGANSQLSPSTGSHT